MRKSFKRNTLSDEKKRRRNIILMSVFMAFLMVSSVFAYIFFYTDQSVSQTVTENGQKFSLVAQNGNYVWQTTIAGQKVTFYRLPSEVATLQVDPVAEERLQNAQSIAVTVDTTMLSDQDISFLFSQLSAVPYDLGAGQTVNLSQFNLPIITCDMSTAAYPVVELTLGEVSQIAFDEETQCVTIQGPDVQSLFELTEKFKYIILKIE
jgi:hypothetical protein